MVAQTALRAEFVTSLRHLPADVLDEIAADGHTFACRSWFNLLDDSPLSPVIGGTVHLRYLVVFAGDRPVAVCPILRAKGQSVYFLYSLKRFYFQHWIEDAIRLNPRQEQLFARLFRAVTGFRKVLEATGSVLDDSLIVGSPLSYRCEVAVAPSSPVPRPAVYRFVAQQLKREARRLGRPLWCLGVEESNTRLRQALVDSGLAEGFLFADNRIDLDGLDDFDDYLQMFRRTTRRAFQRDIRRTEAAGIRFEFIDDFAPLAEQFAELYENTYRKYGDSFFNHPPSFWRQLQERLGDKVEALVGWQGDRMVGFTILLHNRRRGEMWTYRIGRVSDPELEGVPFYFVLSFYEPIRRALELGYRRLWLGPASYEPKATRGAQARALWNYYYFPRRPDRWLLQPYLQGFGKITAEQIEEAINRPRRLFASIAAGSASRHETSDGD